MGFGGLILNNWRSPKLYRVTETEKAVPSMSGNGVFYHFSDQLLLLFPRQGRFQGLGFQPGVLETSSPYIQS